MIQAPQASEIPETDLPARPDSPYRGLVPYSASQADAEFFFGRDSEREVISANLMASRLTLLYGASGVGKSSVLRAGVVHQLRERARRTMAKRGNPESIVVEFSQWRDDPVAGLWAAIDASVSLTMGAKRPPAPSPSRRLDEMLRTWTDALDAELLMIFDQFEEYFLYHGQEDGDGTFAVEFPRAVNRPDLAANFLVSIREDAYAKLDRFKGRIPNVFDNYLRIDHLDRKAARSAIEGPLTAFNRLHPEGLPVGAEPELVNAVLDQVRTGRVVLGQAGRGAVQGESEATAADRIETPFLQLVMSRLWDEETRLGSSVLRLETLTALGGAEQIVRTHLDKVMQTLSPEDQDVAARVFRYLVTRGGTKIAHTAADLAEFAGVDEALVTQVVERLSRGDLRILRAVAPPMGESTTRYEIFHDVLGAAIVDWRARYEQAQAQAAAQLKLQEEKRLSDERARKARRGTRRALVIAAVSVLFAVGVAIMALWALGQKSSAERATREATEQKTLARSRALAASAISHLSIDPAVSLRLALDAVKVSPTAEAAEALREAVSESRVRAVMIGHEDQVLDAEFSPDGTKVVTAGRDGKVFIWEAKTGKKLVGPLQHEDRVNKAEFSRDGRFVATASNDDTAAVWDAATGKRLWKFGSGTAEQSMYTARFSPDGRHLVTGGTDSAGDVWDLTTGQNLSHMPVPSFVNDAAFSPDGRSVALAVGDGIGRIWDWQPNEITHKLKGDSTTAALVVVRYNADGTLLLTGGTDQAIRLWDTSTGKKFGRALIDLHQSVVTANFSADGTYVVAAGGKYGVVWTTSDQVYQNLLQEHTDFVNDIVMSPDERYVATVSTDGTVRVWNFRTNSTLMVLRGHGDSIQTVRFDPADPSKILTASTDGTARIWDIGTGLELRGHTNWVLDATFSPDGSEVATASPDSTARIWNAHSGALITKIDVGGSTGSIDFSPDAKVVATSDGSGNVKTWSVADGSMIHAFAETGLTKAFAVSAAALAFSSDGKLLATAGRDYQGNRYKWVVKIWSVSTGTLTATVSGHTSDVTGVDWSPDSQRLVTSGFDRTLRLWDVSGHQTGIFQGQSAFWSARFSPDGKRVVTADGDGTARVFDVTSPRPRLMRILRGDVTRLSSAVFSPDGRLIATAGAGVVTRIWDAATGATLGVMRDHADAVNALEFSPDGADILSASDDYTAKINRCKTCSSLSALEQLAASRMPRFTDEELITIREVESVGS